MTQTPQPHPVLAGLRYTLRRLALLLAAAALLYALGLRGLVLWVLAIGVSGLLSLGWLRRDRDEMSSGLSNFFGRLNQRIEDSKRREDFD